MSDPITARAIRDATRSLVLALAMCSAFVVIVLPITSVVAVYTAAKWRAETWASQFEAETEKARLERSQSAK